MIISRIIGGLGNQLFQYAAGRSLATKLGTGLKLDVSAFAEKGLRQFELSALHAEITYAEEVETKPFTSLSILRKMEQRLHPPHKRKVYKEPHYHFDPHFFEAGDHTYLKGYWQSWKYFEPIRKRILEEFTVKDEWIKEVKELGKTFREGTGISMHIRRGDYKNPAMLKYNGMLESDYYNAALSKMTELYPHGKIYFFSDDIPWVKENLQISLPHEFVTGHFSKTSLEDFYLMQQCHHHIIANSSFSWRAAYLNQFPGKSVIAPRKWFATPANDIKDLIPEGWILI